MTSALWLPPLNNYPNFYTLVSAKQLYIREDDDPSILEPEPIFSILINVMVKFFSDKATKNRSFHGLSLLRMYRIPCWEITNLSRTHGKEKILSMVTQMRIGFQLKNIFLRRKHFGENGDINWEGSDMDAVAEKIWDFLCSMRRKSYNEGHNHLPLYLEILKIVVIADSQYSAWTSWYREKKRADPGFERSYMNAIRRPRTILELLESVLYEPRAASESSIEALEEVAVDDSSSTTDCLVCLEKLQFGSMASRLPCSHIFHRDCVVKWLQESHMCPLCRFELPPN